MGWKGRTAGNGRRRTGDDRYRRTTWPMALGPARANWRRRARDQELTIRNMNHLATVIDTACPTGSTTTLEPDGRIKPLEHDYARRSDRTIGRAALAVSADRALPGRLAHLDGLAQTMRGTPRAHRRALAAPVSARR